VQIAIALQCIASPAKLAERLLFSGVVVTTSSYATIPGECTLDLAQEFITRLLDKVANGTLLLLTPQSAKFPDFDSLIACKNSDGIACVAGIQVKQGDRYPKNSSTVKPWMSFGFLVRGNAAASSSGKDKWKYLSKSDLKGLLGYSLAGLYPDDLSK